MLVEAEGKSFSGNGLRHRFARESRGAAVTAKNSRSHENLPFLRDAVLTVLCEGAMRFAAPAAWCAPCPRGDCKADVADGPAACGRKIFPFRRSVPVATYEAHTIVADGSH